MNRTLRRLPIALWCLSSISTYAQPQYPAKPVRIIVPFAAGGGTDTIARVLAQKLTETWGQTLLVETRPGAGGLIGFESVLKAPADGYTLGVGTISTLAVIPATQESFLQGAMPLHLGLPAQWDKGTLEAEHCAIHAI